MKTYQRQIAEFILNSEARRDAHGHLAVYTLPVGDGGGSFEIAGINDRYDHDEVYKLKAMLAAGRYDDAENEACVYYLANTATVASWTNVPAIEGCLRDIAFNRGDGGAARTLQIALGVAEDGKVGPNTLAALRTAESNPLSLLGALRKASEIYERQVAPPVGARAKFWEGLVNRWEHRLAFCKTLPMTALPVSD